MIVNNIEHYRQIDIIRKAEKDYYSEYHIKPFDISHWNSGEEYKEGLHSVLKLPPLNDYFDYSYSYSIDDSIVDGILKKNNYVANNCALFNSATSAIATIAQVLKDIGSNNICIISPYYFSAYESLKALNFKITVINCEYDGLFVVPFDKIKKLESDVIWVTQPIFSTGIYIEDSTLHTLEKLCKYLVIDASAQNPNHKISEYLDFNKILYICSPHKIIALNGIKFCFVLCNDTMRGLLEDWGDVVAGNLTSSALMAIKHFLSDNYDLCLKYWNGYINKNKAEINKIIHDYPDVIYSCGFSLDTYEVLRTNKIKFSSEVSYNCIYDIIKNTQVSLTPGCVNGFDKTMGFCFRINHTLDKKNLASSIKRLTIYLQNL